MSDNAAKMLNLMFMNGFQRESCTGTALLGFKIKIATLVDAIVIGSARKLEIS